MGVSGEHGNGDKPADLSAAVLQFPSPALKPNVARLLPMLNAIPEGSTELVEAILFGASMLKAAQGAGTGERPITQADKQRFADALFMIYWASGRLLGLNPQVDLGPEDPDLAG